jgi:chromosome segregation ATPase
VKVKQAIDDMIATLAKEKEDEIVHKDFCTDSFNENEKQTSKNTREKQDLSALIEDLEMRIDELTKAIKQLEAEISEMQVQLKKAGEDREKENKEFQQTVADQLATEKLLGKAMAVLKGVYFMQAAALAQEGQTAPAGPPPPPGFKKGQGQGAAAGGVMAMIQQIIDDAKAMAAEAIKGEEDATAAYEAFVKDTNTQIEERKKEIVNKSEERAVAEGDLQTAQEDKAKVMTTLEELSNESADLHKACDFVLKNFDIRQAARDQEIAALKQANAILSGSKFSEFLQRI